MIPFEEIDSRLVGIDKNRAWLATQVRKSIETVDSALAPKAAPHKRSPSLQGLLTDAIEREEALQTAEKSRPDIEPAPEIPAGHTAIYLSGQELEDADRASRLVGSPSLATFCRDIIRAEAGRILAKQGKANGTDGP